jgi:lysyl-tRNA synthetase class 1
VNLTIPPSVEAVIAKFDCLDRNFDENEVKQALVEARKQLPASLLPDENMGEWGELLAFSLYPSRHQRSPWGTYFGPSASGTKGDGTAFYSPDIAGTDESVVAHWTVRAKTLKHPVLCARYADVAWDLSQAIAKQRPDVDMARTAIDSYLLSTLTIADGMEYARFERVIRALDLAISIGDSSRIETARCTLIRLHREVMAAQSTLWWMAIDRLSHDRRAGLTDAERTQFVTDLESLVRKFSDQNPAVFDPHATENAARRLIRHYRRFGPPEEVNRLFEIIGRTFEHFASLGNASVGAAVLQTAVNAYRDAGLMEESKRARVLMENKIGEIHLEIKPTTFTRTIPREDMETFLESVVVDSVGETSIRIAAEFLLSRKRVDEAVARSLVEAPLAARITNKLLGDKHVSGAVGAVDQDPLGRAIMTGAREISFSDLFLVHALFRAVDKHSLTTELIVSWTARTKLFEDVSLLLEGVDAWFAMDYVKAVHVLVPQVEVALRGIAAGLGMPVTKPSAKAPGCSTAIGMGDLLYSGKLVEAIGADLTLHLLALYADPRGINLRNNVAHGLMPASHCTNAMAARLIHTLLMLGVWDSLAKVRR